MTSNDQTNEPRHLPAEDFLPRKGALDHPDNPYDFQACERLLRAAVATKDAATTVTTTVTGPRTFIRWRDSRGLYHERVRCQDHKFEAYEEMWGCKGVREFAAPTLAPCETCEHERITDDGHE